MKANIGLIKSTFIGVLAVSLNLISMGCSSGSEEEAPSESATPPSPAPVSDTADTTPPAALVLTSPLIANIKSNNMSLNVAGICESGATVSIGGGTNATVECLSGVFSFPLTAASEGTLSYNLFQTDPSGNSSVTSTLKWEVDMTAPAAPIIASPSSNPFTSAGSNVTLSGGCEEGASVTLSGAQSETVPCLGSAFSFNLIKSTDGVFDYSLVQSDPSLNLSSSTPFQWIRDTSVPADVVVTQPALASVTTNANTYVLSGTCTSTYNVILSGEIDASEVSIPLNSLSQTCMSGSFSFTIGKTVDGTFNFSVSQQNPQTNVSSSSVSRIWNRDTVAPSAPHLVAPAISPYTSGSLTLILSGQCEVASQVNLTGAQSGTALCADGSFSFLLAQAGSGAYVHAVSQTDAGGNISSSTSFEWDIDTSIPASVTITAPVMLTTINNQNSLIISGTCINTYDVNLAGDITAPEVTAPAGTLSQTCSGGVFSFTLAKSLDGSFSFAVSQINTTTGSTSAPASVFWTRDTQAPAAPTILSPSTSPFYQPGTLLVSGACDDNNSVFVSGDESASTTCASGSFSFSISESVDGTYNYDFTQMDSASNVSSAATLQFVRDSSSVAPPTVTLPLASSVTSNSSTFVIAGGCNSGFTVSLSGDLIAAEADPGLTQVCSANSYSFSVTKSVDGVFNFSLKQTNLAATDSSTVSRSWIRDTQAPTATLTSTPSNPILTFVSSFAFSSNDPAATFECSLDNAAFASCTSPATYSSLANGSHTFSVKAKDIAGNYTPTPASNTWTQSAYKTIALYQFTSGSDFTDSSSYTGAEKNDLTNSNTTTTATGKFTDGRAFASASSQFLSKADNLSQDTILSTMTFELFAKFATLPTNGNYMVIASKSGASGQYSWELKLKRTGSNYYLTFSGSLNGTTLTEVKSSGFSAPVSTTFYHLTVTWDRGNVKFFKDGVAIGMGTIGTPGSAKLFSSTADFRLGRVQTMSSGVGYFNGTMDEVRMSQVIRYSVNFTPTISAFSAD